MAISSARKLPDDLIPEILSWLPVKNLMRLRCVSMTWNSLIMNPYFVKLYLKKSSRNPQILFHEDLCDEAINTLSWEELIWLGPLYFSICWHERSRSVINR
ncbi:hypothetical protein VIGAN_11042400 [Vigna angularis var. angularis]|uniref:F-box domain-containing protein n=1 Tax=Vigna angularis var. angularis TaxID=157739 RepID=A0A0S3T8I7_PHAAN|nr:hypothetical protein VIGAN_11042400 [Vigna angularis var. angularis]